MAKRYGFIGLGNLGRALAGSLKRAGFELYVHDADPGAAKALLAEGAMWSESPRALGASVEAVITCLPSPAVSERVLNGPDGVLMGLKPGSTWIEISTNDSETIQRLAAIAADRGVSRLSGDTSWTRRSPAGSTRPRRERSPSSSAARRRCSSGIARRSRRWGGRSFT